MPRFDQAGAAYGQPAGLWRAKPERFVAGPGQHAGTWRGHRFSMRSVHADRICGTGQSMDTNDPIASPDRMFLHALLDGRPVDFTTPVSRIEPTASTVAGSRW